ncbi:hypothetical protein [Streptomyces sp. ST2-7A]|uniref:hypothetical protein n=1 Tax=Streptomyces sp. ST2-7A TaxID=2907214 RepID=UPI001F3A0610|nr:hypothetical protein [Streptomyces sp. ST2-7A]MCE7079099.1 hypothetical protein [Streptomyces sp. ST2-7A]
MVDASREEFGACRYTALARALPSRIAPAAAPDGNACPEGAATAVADPYTIATRLCVKLGEDGLAAKQAAPQEVRRAPVRVMTADLVRYDRTLPGVRTFARRIGALA